MKVQRKRASKQPLVTSKPVDPSPARLGKSLPVKASAMRLLSVWAVLTASTLGLGVNLYRLQVTQTSTLKQWAQEQQMIYLRPFIPRRPIVDRNGAVLAIDQPVYILYAHPKLFKVSKSVIAAKLAPVLNRPIASVLKQLDQRETGIQVEYALSEDIANRILDWQMDGLELIRNQQRVYPQKDLAADVVGYVNSDRQGQAGVEYSQQSHLERTAQSIQISRTGSGALMPEQLPGGFLNVDNLRLQLTLDTRLQRTARFALKRQLKQFKAKRGSVIVMDAKDGAILALAAEPSYDPNYFYKYDPGLFKNWALTDLYEPGSTFKPINVAIALEAGAIKPNSVFNDVGQLQIGGWPIGNYDYSTRGSRGLLTLSQILQYSSNVGMVRIVQQMKPEVYYGWLERLGLGQTTGSDLPFESASQLKTQEQFTQGPIEPATASFGQGLSLTPLQVTQLHAALVNGGQLISPRIVRGLFSSDGQLHWQPKQPAPRRIFSPKTTQAVLSMMEDVVSKGTGKPAKIPGYRVGGKTGTAQKANPNGGYMSNAKITSFVGIFPMQAPRYVVLAVIDEPQGDNAFGSTVTAPIVKAVIESLITMDALPPSQ
ncbi:MAG: penicillin-binding protein 2 [Leptolyngbyaceae bacterium]|nr:penicillin-binding protein 2 [Leptolyngbyaceae bacterium]